MVRGEDEAGGIGVSDGLPEVLRGLREGAPEFAGEFFGELGVVAAGLFELDEVQRASILAFGWLDLLDGALPFAPGVECRPRVRPV